jgi:hypothetical protein
VGAGPIDEEVLVHLGHEPAEDAEVLARARLERPVEEADERALARAARADERQLLAAFDGRSMPASASKAPKVFRTWAVALSRLQAVRGRRVSTDRARAKRPRGQRSIKVSEYTFLHRACIEPASRSIPGEAREGVDKGEGKRPLWVA